MHNLSLKLEAGLDARLKSAAERSGKSKSQLIREALEAYLTEREGAPAGSCLDLAEDLAGCLRGPGDLSTNRRRLKDYGK